MPSQRLIRRQSLAQRLSSYPQDLLLSLNETYELLEWDALSDTLSIPIGIVLNAIYLLARLDHQGHSSSYRDKDIFTGSRVRDSGVFIGKSGGFHTLVGPPLFPFACDSWMRAYGSCICSLGDWWGLVLRTRCIVLLNERIIARSIRSQM